MKPIRDPLSKEGFLSGNRQRWAVIFLAMGTGVLISNILVPGLDPVPYMQFLLAIGSLFILGASGDSWVKAYSVKSLRETEVKEETKRIVVDVKDDSEPDTNIINNYRMQYANDKTYAPESWIEEQSTGGNFR